MHHEDMSRKCQVGSGPDIRVVGWLSEDNPYTQGEVSPVFLARLRRHVQEAWQPIVAMGLHECELCSSNPVANGKNLWIPARKVVYIAPAMILHYIEVHGYQPPKPFMDAVIACPWQKTPEFEQAMEPYLYHWNSQTPKSPGIVQTLWNRMLSTFGIKL